MNDKRKEIEDSIRELIARIEALPPSAMIVSANQYDLLSILYLLLACLDCKSES